MKRVVLFAAAVLMLSSLIVAKPAAPTREISFADRLKAQEAIERVYYSHLIGATKPFEEVVPASLIEKKVRTYLQQTVALEKFWNTRVTDEALSREVERISRTTRDAGRLGELTAALDNDPIKIRECLARPALVSRLVRNFYAGDPRIHGAERAEAEALKQRLESGVQDAKDPHHAPRIIELVREGADHPDPALLNPAAVDAPSDVAHPSRQPVTDEELGGWRSNLTNRSRGVGELREERTEFVVPVLIEDKSDAMTVAFFSVPKKPQELWWKQVEAGLDPSAVRPVRGSFTSPVAHTKPVVGMAAAPIQPEFADVCAPAGGWDGVDLDGTPAPRGSHTAVWTGSLMIVWGGSGYLRSGGRYDPATDTWEPTSTVNAPEGRGNHTAVWTGSRMILWGGTSQTAYLNTGGVYDPVSDSWTTLSVQNAPDGRWGPTAVWTGTEMLVWGGLGAGDVRKDTGGRYNPATDLWAPIQTAGAPAARYAHAAVWTGARMVIWGGAVSSGVTDTGGRYDPASDSWLPTKVPGAPLPRQLAAAVWTGSRMIIWGGASASSYLDSGGSYDPVSNTWTSTSTNGAPAPRVATSVWTGTRMIVWGGADQAGGQYDPIADAWTPTSTAGAPGSRSDHSAVWTGNQMIVWGGAGSGATFSGITDSGGRYDPVGDSWTPTSQGDAPSARFGHTAVWTGNEMIVWGGSTSNTGGRYDLSLNLWNPTSVLSAPQGGTAVWSGHYMIIWNSLPGGGGRYNPITDTWIPVASAGAPSPRSSYTTVWTGSRMVVWGGNQSNTYVNTGGRYDPETDIWSATSTVGAPAGRQKHTAIWTGSRMIVWGGIAPPNYLNTGGSYDPLTDTWSAISTVGAPVGRVSHSAVWSGSRMIVWGGGQDTLCPQVFMNTGGRYDPATDTWLSTALLPEGRSGHTAIWSGSPGLGEMIVWGGYAITQYTFPCSPIDAYYPPGYRYNPVSNTWTMLTVGSAPGARAFHTALSTTNYMLIWGGGAPNGNSNFQPNLARRDGGRFVLVENYDADGDGYTLCGGDCNDGNPAVHPGGTEACNGLDDDCNGQVDDGFPDIDGDGYSVCLGDCIDSNPSIHPGATEVCNGVDENCDGVVDEGFDQDTDGFKTCTGDCNDSNAAVHPGATEVCNGIDDNCDAGVDDVDTDSDGSTICVDCNDIDPAIHPGATELCNGVDDNCIGGTDEGFDQDGDSYKTCSGDCNDANPAVHPGATEVCNGQDDDCDDNADEGFDQDSDGFTSCAGDCNDANPAVHPGAVEICDGFDDDCNGMIDDDFDLDGDGVTACNGDCNNADPGTWDYPVELFDLSVDASAPTLVSWFDLGPLIGPAITYDLVSGSVGPGSGIVFTGATCLQSGSSSPSYADTRPNPPVGSGAWYLVRARNSCGNGTYGASSAGVERTVPSCP